MSRFFLSSQKNTEIHTKPRVFVLRPEPLSRLKKSSKKNRQRISAAQKSICLCCLPKTSHCQKCLNDSVRSLYLANSDHPVYIEALWITALDHHGTSKIEAAGSRNPTQSRHREYIETVPYQAFARHLQWSLPPHMQCRVFQKSCDKRTPSWDHLQPQERQHKLKELLGS